MFYQGLLFLVLACLILTSLKEMKFMDAVYPTLGHAIYCIILLDQKSVLLAICYSRPLFCVMERLVFG